MALKENGTKKQAKFLREYYNRSGKFENIPDKYPCVIYFSYVNLMNVHCDNDDLLWIYIGEEKEK